MTNLQRFYDLLLAGTGIIRTRNVDLELEALERAFEARQQVGLTGSTGIVHPTQAEREARLGPEWSQKGVVELGSWLWQWNDPIKALVDSTSSNGTKVGLLNSEPHRSILLDPSFVYWGAGLYDELPPGEPEINRRYYGVVWMSKLVPSETPKQAFTDVPPDHPFYGDIQWAADNGIAATGGTGKFNPDQPVTRAQMMAFIHRAHKLK